MPGDFDDRIRELQARIGGGRLEGSCEVSQLYAQYQHEGADLRHPRGGQAFYLSTPLFEQYDGYYQNLADALLDGDLHGAMSDAMENLSGQVERLAPIELGPLHFSGHPVVVDDGATVYDRAPITPRLTEAELRAARRAAEAATD